jgi:hypothetical protein
MLEPNPLRTVGDLRRIHFPRVQLHQLKYALSTYNIEPRARAGTLRLYHVDQLAEIRNALRRTTGMRGLEVANA